GSGKSVAVNAMVLSLLYKSSARDVRMLMIDPKMVELSGYGRLPHLMHPVVTDMKKAEAILAWAVEKMEERYALLARAGVRHIVSYNQLGEEELMERLDPDNAEERAAIPLNLPFIVIVADEMADLMMTAGKEVEQHIIRLAQKSRAVGIHLILATQKPTVDVITGLIKSNLPARLAFQVASRTDSRVVLDEMGADKLLGNGDMLFLWPGTSTLLRGQGTYLSDDEIESITESVSKHGQNFVHELVNLKVEKPGEETTGTDRFKKRDELYESAIDCIVREQRGSVSLLQRTLGIGYGRAARLIDFMCEDGIVGPYNGSQAREILLTLDEWERMQAAGGDAPAPAATNSGSGGGAASGSGAAKRNRIVMEAEEADDEEEDEETDAFADEDSDDEELPEETVDEAEDEDEASEEEEEYDEEEEASDEDESAEDEEDEVEAEASDDEADEEAPAPGSRLGATRFRPSRN
ncbi:MAG TPA: DNA translocase FtsK, partial [Planctomycetaceae bacterium]|nr:DNA translocase FtsK [Planctomycetaceae bacterium]